MKTKKIEEMAKKTNPDRNHEKALSKKKRPSTARGAAAEKDSDFIERKKAESQRETALEAMVKSENRFRSIFESSHDAIMTLEPPYWKFTSGNPAALKMFMAKDEADFASHEPWTMSPERQPDGRASIEKAKEMIEIAMADGSNFFEWTHKRLNGEEFPATVLLTRMILAEKTILQATVRDITERKRAESQREAALEALQKSHDELDCQVQERTAELAQANEMLKADIIERKRVEKQVVRAARDWQQTFDATNDAIWILDKDQRILRSNKNKTTELFFNHLPEDLIGKYCWEIVHGSTKPIPECPILRAQISLHRERIELQIGAGWFEFTVDPITDTAGQYSGAVHIITDISERMLVELQKKAALEALRRSEENFRRSLEDSPLGVRVVTAKGETIFANKVFLDIYGYADVEELNKIPLKERYTPQSYAEFHIRKKARDRGDFGSSEYKIAIVRKNGEIRHLQVLRKEVLWNGSKQFQVIYQDITERKRAEEALRESEERFRIAAENASDLIWEWDIVNGKLEWFGAIDAILGYAPGEFPRTIDAWKRVIHVDDRDHVMAVLDQHLKTQSPYCEEYRVYHKDGTMGYWTDKGVAVCNGQGHPYKMIGVCTDISERKRAEAALKQANERLLLAIVAGGVGIWDLDVVNNKLSWDDQMFRLYGIAPDNFGGAYETWKARVHPEDVERGDAEVQMALRGEKEFDTEFRVVWPSGTIHHIRARARVHRDAAGQPTKLIGTNYDITERKRAEEALRKSEGKYRGLTENINLGIYRNTVGPKGKFIEANPAIIGMFGYKSKEEFLAINVSDLYQNPEDRNKFNDKMLKEGFVKGEELWLKKKDGSFFVGSVSAVAVKDEQDHVKYYDGIIDNITERKRAEQELHESEARYRAFFNTSRDCVFITSVAGRWLYMNDAAVELFGYSSREELSQVNIPNLYANPEERAKFISTITERGYTKEFPVDLRRKDGVVIHALITAVPEYDADGNVTGFQGTIRDITERRRAEESIRSSLAEKEVLLKEVHHRVKNNLMTIIGLIKMQETKANNEMFNHLLLELEGRVRSMALVHESFHKSEDLAHVDLQNYIETMSAHIRAQFGAERDIRFSVQAVGVDVGLDIAVPCGLILNELITNAYKHAFPGDKTHSGEGNCEIAITVKHEGGVLTLTVRDNGVGLPSGVDWENPETSGLRLIRMLSQQIKGYIELDRSAGTVIRLKFLATEP